MIGRIQVVEIFIHLILSEWSDRFKWKVKDRKSRDFHPSNLWNPPKFATFTMNKIFKKKRTLLKKCWDKLWLFESIS